MVVWERQMVEPAWRAGGGKICQGVVDTISRRVIHSC